MFGMKVVDYITDCERYEDEQNAVEIEWDGEIKTVRTYTRGTADRLYCGSSMEAARESLELSNEEWDLLLASEVQYLESA